MNAKRAQTVHRQSGIALFIVLILLFVLAAASTALIQNQRWAVRQTADRLDALEQNAQSSIAHDQCVANFRNALENPNRELVGYVGNDEIIGVEDAKWGASNQCLYEWYQIPAQSPVDAPWTPRVRINSRVKVKGVWMQELSEWRYPECTVATSSAAPICASSATPLKVGQTNTVLKAQFNPAQAISSARSRVATQ